MDHLTFMPPEPLGCVEYDSVTLTPCSLDPAVPSKTRLGAFASDGTFLHSFRMLRSIHASPIEEFPDAVEDQLTGTFVYGGVMRPHYGHFLMESLARAWFLREFPDLPILWHTANGKGSLSAWRREIFALLGISEERFHFVLRPTAVQRVLLPDPGSVLERWLDPMHARALGVFPFAKYPQSGRRVWLSRSRLPTHLQRIAGEAELETKLAEGGWSIVHPEQLTVREQLASMADAEEIAGFEGSAFYTLLLADHVQARITMYRRGRGHLPVSHSLIASAKHLRISIRELPLRAPGKGIGTHPPTLSDPAAAARLVMEARRAPPAAPARTFHLPALSFPPGAPAILSGADRPSSEGSKRKLAFIHIPKTAGTSLTTTLMGGWPRARVVATQAQFDAISDDEIESLDLVAGHFRAYRFEDRRLPDFAAVTVLRDPFERLFSSYRFARAAVIERGVDADAAMRLAAENTFGDWCLSRFGYAQLHNHLWFLGLNAYDRPARIPLRQVLAQAKARLDRIHVGTTDNLDSFVGYLFRLRELPEPAPVANMNITRRYEPEEAGLTAAQKSELIDLMRPDYELLAYGRDLMLRRIEALARAS